MLLNALVMMMHIALGHNVSAESYVDDLTLLSLNSTSLQRAMDVVSDFMGLGDQKVNEKKTKCFALKDPPGILYEGQALGTTDKVKILGVKDGYFELNVPGSEVEEMCALRFSGITFQHRVLLCGSLIMSKILCGIEVNDFNLNAQQERTLRSALGYAIWTKTDKARNPG